MSPKAPPAALQPTCSRFPSSEISLQDGRERRLLLFVVSARSEMCFCLCVSPRAVIRTASGCCWTDDVFSLVSAHTHTHTFHSGSAARQLWMFVGATYQHSSQPSAAFQLPDPLTPSSSAAASSAALSHSVCRPHTQSHLTSRLVSHSALKPCFSAGGVR